MANRQEYRGIRNKVKDRNGNMQVYAGTLDDLLSQEQKSNRFFLQEIQRLNNSPEQFLPAFLGDLKELEKFTEEFTLESYSILRDGAVKTLDGTAEFVISGGDAILSKIRSMYMDVNKVLMTSVAVIGFTIGTAKMMVPESTYVTKPILTNNVRFMRDDGDEGNLNENSLAAKVKARTFKKNIFVDSEKINTAEKNSTLNSVKGAATIYANHFEGDKTSSGMIFYHDSISGAVPMKSEWVPKIVNGKYLLSVLQVTNIDNGRSIQIIANDVGNFGYTKNGTPNKYLTVDNKIRVLDLSKEATRRLEGRTKEEYGPKGRKYVPLNVEVTKIGEIYR